MIRNFKAFGLVVVAMLALGAFAAQGASATPLTAEGTQATTFVTGDQDGSAHVLKTPNGTISCAEADFSTSFPGTSATELSVIPSYPTEKAAGGTNCTAFGFANTHITTTNCTYTFTTPTRISSTEVTWHPEQVHVVAHPEKTCVIKVTPTSVGVSVCTTSIETQTPTGGHIVGKNITDSNGSGKMAVTLEITLSGIHYKGTGGVCGENITNTNATLEGKSTVRCYSDEARKNQVGCTFS